MKRLSLWILAAVLLAGGAAQAQQMFDITNPGDPLVGVPDDNNWPAGEFPINAIDDVISGAKYLCFETSFVDLDGNVDTANGGAGFRVTPSGPRVVVKALNFASANDAVERDPVAFRFSGSDESIDGPYTLIAEGTIDEFDQATAYPRNTWISTPILIKNRKAYNHYEVFFTDIRDRASANSMQIGEVELLSDGSLPGAAGGPVPEDGAIDIPRDVVVAWTAGDMAATHDVYFGTVFADVNDASRTNPMGVLVSQGQTAATYDPAGLLEFGQTYYWRVDEVNSAPDFTIFKGDVWTFTVEPFAYPIANIIATTNAISDEGAGIENTVNGSGLNAADQHSTESNAMWLGLPADGPIWIQYEFDRVYKLHQLLVWNYNVEFEIILGFGLKDVAVEYSADGVDWTAFGDVEFAKAAANSTYTANTTVDFDGVPAKFVRFTVNSGWGPMGQYGLSEVRFTYVPANAREPQPEDGATGVAVGSPLSWRAGREAVSHDVYFGTDPEALALATTTDAATYAPAELNLGTTYYWRVDEVNEADAVPVWEGDLWSFTAEEFIVVDDFESYTDDIEGG
ncbi:MAG TPA: discoidin domain-containing protein, partial [Sedimentisphaerales bacterium]|nr:discoidin domain-containing protein [Sedimentisphaerales bacterium]